MSLSLSRQTECEFEVDLFHFFLGCLIVLLMKIKLALAIVGVGFSYALIILRSSLDTTSYQNLAVQDDHSVVIDVNSLHTENGSSMMQQLMACVKALRQGNSNFTNMLLDHTKEYMRLYESEPEGIDHNFVIDVLSLGKINDLHKTIKLMVDNGFEKECCEVYRNWRRESLEECLISLFGMQKVINMVQLEEHIIERWIKVLKVALRILFPSEQRLSHVVFSGYSSVADLCFTEVCQGATIELLNMADAFASGSPSQWRLSKIIRMFAQLSDLIPQFQSLLPESLVKEVITVQDKLEEASRDIFMKMENMIFRMPELKAIAPANGKLHPMITYVTSYLIFAHGAEHKLEQILRQYPAFINGVAISSVFEDYGLKEYPKLDDRVPSSSSLSVQMDWIMELLESNLEAKSKIYKDPALCYVFLMNNGRYIVQKTKDSELGGLLGDDWIRKHAAKVRQFHVHYQRSSWNKVLGILKMDSNGSVPPNGLAKSMKEKLKTFNAVFEEICREQSSWFVFDEQLREEIRISLEKILLPAYGNFVGRFQSVPELGKHADKYVKYGTEDIQARLNELFQGSIGSAGSRK